jgi:hypothetical protein
MFDIENGKETQKRKSANIKLIIMSLQIFHTRKVFQFFGNGKSHNMVSFLNEIKLCEFETGEDECIE